MSRVVLFLILRSPLFHPPLSQETVLSQIDWIEAPTYKRLKTNLLTLSVMCQWELSSILILKLATPTYEYITHSMPGDYHPAAVPQHIQLFSSENESIFNFIVPSWCQVQQWHYIINCVLTAVSWILIYCSHLDLITSPGHRMDLTNSEWHDSLLING